jgi:phosphatidylinositol glycan class V
MFCDGLRPPELVPWCSSMPTGASLYGFIQKNYWNVGVFNYWELKQVPNFLIAMPMIILSSVAIFKYFKHGQNLKSTLTLGLLPGDNSSITASEPYYNRNVSSYILHWLFLLIFGILVMYIQVLNRFLSSQCAPLYWFAADALLQKARATKEALMPKLITVYFVIYCFVGTILFTSFYPWT